MFFFKDILSQIFLPLFGQEPKTIDLRRAQLEISQLYDRLQIWYYLFNSSTVSEVPRDLISS